MKKYKSIILIIIIIFTLSGCQNSTSQGDIKITLDKSAKFSAKEMNDAISAVRSKFSKDFHGCNLTAIWYDESMSNKEIERYGDNGSGDVNKAKETNVIVLLSDFTVNPSGADVSLNPNSKYSSWKWILTRDNKNDKWSVFDMGY